MAGSTVGKACPKCAHVRAASDAGPDWQCPKCGIAYAKFRQAASAPDAGASADRTSVGEAARRPPGQSYTLATFAHLSVLLGLFIPLLAIIVPIVIWKTKGDADPFAASAAKEAINFQISFFLWIVGLGLAALACTVAPPLVYLVALLMAIVLLAYVVLPLVAAFKTLSGDGYTYPYIRHFFE